MKVLNLKTKMKGVNFEYNPEDENILSELCMHTLYYIHKKYTTIIIYIMLIIIKCLKKVSRRNCS